MFRYISILVVIFLFSSCSTTQIEDNKFSFTSPDLPGMTISGITAQEDGRDILYITQVRLFSNWPNGWTEGFFEASGKYVMEKSGRGYTLTPLDTFELWDITSGEIRYHDTYYRGDDGLWKVKNRVDRLRELSRVLKTDLYYPDTVYLPEKQIYLKLFPEVFNKMRFESNEYSQTDYVRGSGINWINEYTQAELPEEFWELRNSGTLYRDCIEAPQIFRSIYNLESYFNKGELKI